MDEETLSRLDADADQLIRNWSGAVFAGNLLPPPFDMMAVGGAFAGMGAHLARVYGVETNMGVLRDIGRSLAQGIGAVLVGSYVGTGLLKYVPGVNIGIALLIQPPLVGAAAFAVGHAFKRYYHALLLEGRDLTSAEMAAIASDTLQTRLDVLKGSGYRIGLQKSEKQSANVRPVEERPYEQRKSIVIVPPGVKKAKIAAALNKRRWLLVPLCLDRGEIRTLEFSDANPREGLVYTGHPFVPKLYYRTADFHTQVLEHKRQELVRILRGLGATHYRIEWVRGFRRTTKAKAAVGAPFNIGKADVSLQGEHNTRESINVLWEEWLKPAGALHLPTDLVWYKQEPQWQDAAAGRLRYQAEKQNWTIGNERDFGITGSAISELTAPLKIKAFKLDIGGEFTEFEKTEWRVSVSYE